MDNKLNNINETFDFILRNQKNIFKTQKLTIKENIDPSVGWTIPSNIRDLNSNTKLTGFFNNFAKKLKDEDPKCVGTIISGGTNFVNFKINSDCTKTARVFPILTQLKRGGPDNYNWTETSGVYQISLQARNYSYANTQSSERDPYGGQAELDPELAPVADTAKKLLDVIPTLKEEKVFGNFGKQVKTISGTKLISKDKNPKIYSAINGVVNNSRANSSCFNKITIEHYIDNQRFYLEYCGITNPVVRDGQTVSKGMMLGTTNDDVRVTLYDERWDKQPIDSYLNKEIIVAATAAASTPILSKLKPSKKTKYKDESPIKSKKVKDYDYELDDPKKEPFKWHDPLLGAAVDMVLKPLEFVKGKVAKNIKWPTEKKQYKSWFKEQKLSEQTERIKKLMK